MSSQWNAGDDAFAARDQTGAVRIVHVTTVHPRDDIRIARKECATLAGVYGSVVLVVCDGRGDETTADGIRIVDAGARPRGRVRRIIFAPRRAARRVKALRPQIVHLHDPELLAVAVHLTRSGAKVVYDAHEDVPRQVLTKGWIPAPARRLVAGLFERYENSVTRRIAGVVGATPHITARFRRSNPRSVEVANFPLPEELASPDRTATRENAVCYVGGIRRIRGLGPLIEALPRVPDIRLVLCGQFAEPDFEREMRTLPGWRQVDYRGQVDRAGVREVMARCIAGVVTFLPAPNHVDAQPNKMFEYMSAGLPVIASDFPLWREIIEGSGCGICADPTSPEEIAGSMRRLLGRPELVEQMGRAGRHAVAVRYNWPAAAGRLLQFYEEIL